VAILDGVKSALRFLLRRGTYDRELEEEVRFHLDLEAMNARANGLSSRDAEDAARRRLGNVTYVMEETRRMNGFTAIELLRQDVRYGLRALRRSPVFTMVAAGSLALGIGANTAVFGLLYSVLLETLPVPRPDQIVQPVRPGTGKGLVDQFDIRAYDVLRRSPGLADLAGFANVGLPVDVDRDRRYTGVQFVTGNYFPVLGLRPLRGRLITPSDERPPANVAVISYAMWQSVFNGASNIVGRSVTVNDMPFTVVGVTPREFRGVLFPDAFQLAVPLAAAPLAAMGAHSPTALTLIGRLESGASLDAASAAMSLLAQRSAEAFRGRSGAASGPDQRLTLVSAGHGIPSRKSDIRSQYRRLLLILMGGVTVVLLIACANVASLLLARGAARRRELAVRLSVGASRGRIITQLLIESVLLALIGGAAALLLAYWGNAVLTRNLPADTAILADIVRFRPNAAILGFTGLVAIATGVIFGIVPAVRASRVDLAPMLKESARQIGGGDSRLGSTLIVAQVALSLFLLVSAGLFVRSLRNLRQLDGGFERENRLLALVDPRGTPFQRAPLVPLYTDILDRARRHPGITSAALSSFTPVLGGMRAMQQVSVPGYVAGPDEDLSIELNFVSSGFFQTMGIAMVAGRDFTSSDEPGSARVVVVSRAFADRFFRGGNPVGEQFAMNEGNGTSGPSLTVIGVAADAKYSDLRRPAPLMIYFPYTQAEGDWRYLTLSLRTAGDPLSLASAIRRDIDAAAPGIRITRSGTLDEALDASLAQERFAAALASVFGVLALLLATVGLYGLLAYRVARHTAEFGVRMALGAGRGDVLGLVLRQTLALAATGVAIGVLVSWAGTRVIANQLFGIGATDLTTLASAIILLTGVALLAGFVPAHKASRIDPVIAMRSE
jgi:macrolide transport system ATP-binding/permease protein